VTKHRNGCEGPELLLFIVNEMSSSAGLLACQECNSMVTNLTVNVLCSSRERNRLIEDLRYKFLSRMKLSTARLQGVFHGRDHIIQLRQAYASIPWPCRKSTDYISRLAVNKMSSSVLFALVMPIHWDRRLSANLEE